MAKVGSDLDQRLGQLEKRLKRLELKVFPPAAQPEAQRKQLEKMLRTAEGWSLQIWFREFGHEPMAYLMQTLPLDIVEKLRKFAPAGMWKRWIEAADGNSPSVSHADSLVAEALHGLRVLEEMGQIVFIDPKEKPFRPSGISAAKWKENRAIAAKREELAIHARAVVQKMKELL